MIIEKTNKIINQTIFFFIGIFVSAILFLFILKAIGFWGIVSALLVSFGFNYYFKIKFADSYLMKAFNLGLFFFNLLTAILGIIFYIALFGAQNALN